MSRELFKPTSMTVTAWQVRCDRPGGGAAGCRELGPKRKTKGACLQAAKDAGWFVSLSKCLCPSCRETDPKAAKRKIELGDA